MIKKIDSVPSSKTIIHVSHKNESIRGGSHAVLHLQGSTSVGILEENPHAPGGSRAVGHVRSCTRRSQRQIMRQARLTLAHCMSRATAAGAVTGARADARAHPLDGRVGLVPIKTKIQNPIQ